MKNQQKWKQRLAAGMIVVMIAEFIPLGWLQFPTVSFAKSVTEEGTASNATYSDAEDDVFEEDLENDLECLQVELATASQLSESTLTMVLDLEEDVRT